MSESRSRVTLYVDGACKGNPGPGGWGVVQCMGDTTKEFSGSESATTNQRMELQAAIEGIRRLKEPCYVTVYSDSEYVVTGMNEWRAAWERNKWRNAANKPVANADLWRELIRLAALHSVKWEWIRGHNGHSGNEMANMLAQAAAKGEAVCCREKQAGISPDDEAARWLNGCNA